MPKVIYLTLFAIIKSLQREQGESNILKQRLKDKMFLIERLKIEIVAIYVIDN